MRHQADAEDDAVEPRLLAAGRFQLKSGGAIAAREYPFAHPPGQQDGRPPPGQVLDQRLAVNADQPGQLRRDGQQQQPRQRHHDLPQRGDKAGHFRSRPGAAAQEIDQPGDPAAAARDQHQAQHQQQQNHRKVGIELPTFNGRFPGSAGLVDNFPQGLQQCLAGFGPMRGVQRGGPQFQQPVGAPFPYQVVDLADQPVGAGIGLFGRNHRCAQARQLFVQLCPPSGDICTFGLFAGLGIGRRTQGGNLLAQGVDALAVLALRRQEAFAPGGQVAAQHLQRLVRGAAGLDGGFGTVRGARPVLIIDRLLRQRGAGPEHQAQHQQPCPQNRDMRICHGAPAQLSTKTPGIDAGARVIQPGTGRPFSFRNSGLNSLD